MKINRTTLKFFFSFLSFLAANTVSAQQWSNDDEYIQKFAPYAVKEMEKYKIPASITLAQGLLETGGGQSRLAQEGKNHFGIKCKENWTGKTMKHTDDAPNECFRVYDDPKQSYEDHSIFLATRKFYEKLFLLDPKDYKAWAHGLKKAGYATNPKYASILISKIEKYQLYDFDNSSSKDIYATLSKRYPNGNFETQTIAKNTPESKKSEKEVILNVPYKATSFADQQKRVEKIKSKEETINSILIQAHPNGGLKYIVVPDNLFLDQIAKKYNIKEAKLLKWNDLTHTRLQKNDILFLEPKNYDSDVATYTSEKGDTMHKISQKFGIKLYKLYFKNRMNEGENPKIGQIIYLKERKPIN